MTAPLAAILAERRRRVATLQQKLKAKRLGALLVYDRFNTFYLTGLHCSLSYLLITPREAVLFVDGRYIEVARATVTHLDVRLMTNHTKTFAALQREFNLREVGFEGSTPWSVLQTWQQQIANAQWHEAGDLMLDQRLIKSPYEARLIEASARLNDRIYAQALAAVHAGATEIE
jgi:Xaa-Pro aminopeptidase